MTDQQTTTQHPGLAALSGRPLLETIFGRRTHRVSRGSSISAGSMSYQSAEPRTPLTELEEACTCRKPRPRRSRGMFVLVEDAAEAIPSSNVEVGHFVRVGDRRGQRVQRAGVRDALVWAVSVVELLEQPWVM